MTRCPDCPLKYARSEKQHGRFFAVLSEAYKHWPESVDFQPRDAEHLRFYLELGAGHFDVKLTIRPDRMDAASILGLLTAVLSKSDSLRMFIEEERGLIVCKMVKSIAWAKLGQDEFSRLSQEVYDVLAVHGLDHDRLLAEKDKAA